MRKTLSSESKAEQVARVHQMAADDGETWDLSLNDRAALEGLIADREALLDACRRVATRAAEALTSGALSPNDVRAVELAIVKAEGRS